MTIDQWILTLTIVAIITSPVIALWITDIISSRREARSRQYNLLRKLMATRRARLDQGHVNALNLVELEFYNSQKVRFSYKAYVRHLSLPFPDSNSQVENFISERNDLFSELLFEIAKDLGYSFDKSDLDRLGYQPIAYEDHSDNQLVISRLVREVLEGRRSLPITNFVQNDGIFPPKPSSLQIESKK